MSATVRAPRLRRLVLKHVSECLQTIRDYLEAGESVPRTFEDRYVIERLNPDGSIGEWSQTPSAVVHSQALLSMLRDRMTSTDSFVELSGLLSSPPLCSALFPEAPHSDEEIRNGVFHRCTRPFLLACLERNDLAPSPGTLEALYERFEAYLQAKRFNVIVRAPLSDFSSDLDSCDLGEGLTIRRLTTAQRESLLRESESGLISRWDALRMRFGLATIISVRKNGPLNVSPAIERFDRAIYAMRLLKAGAVSFYFHRLESAAPPFFQASSAGARYAVTAAGPRFHLAADHVEDLATLYARLKRPRQEKQFLLALDRFNRGAERQKYEDRLIDYWVALEALFSPADQQELRYRLALRIAYLLADSAAERLTLYDAVRGSYDARSAVVHGRAPKVSMEDITGDTEDILRRALRRILFLPEAFDPDQLDRTLVLGAAE
jgi:hypothetical protein